MVKFGTRSVQTPSRGEWLIGRRWISRRLPRWRKVSTDGAAEASWLSLPDLGGPDDFGAAIAILVGTLIVAVILVPLLLFGIELILLGFAIAAGILGRALLGRPWVVQATPLEGSGEMVWKVKGWRRSNRLIDEVATALAAGLEPAPAESAERLAIER